MVKEPDQTIRISDIPSSAVGFDLPYCYIHSRFMKVDSTRRSVDENRKMLTVRRKCYCQECRKSGIHFFQVVSNCRRWDVIEKKTPPCGTSSPKMPNDEN